MMTTCCRAFAIAITVIDCAASGGAYSVSSYALPDDVKFEASGLAVIDDGRLAVTLRKGEVWILDNPQANPRLKDQVGFRKFASGLHEPLGIAWHQGSVLVVQRSEVTRLRDSNQDGIADEFLCVAKGWGVSGNYHEYAYGPVVDRSGSLWITLNARLGPRVVLPGDHATEHPWRGWAMRIDSDGQIQPAAAGLRSPFGLGVNLDGDVFCTDQQGNWWPTNPLLHLRPGVFYGHGDSVPDTRRPESPVVDPGTLPEGITVVEAARRVRGLVLPAVWFPYVKAGQSPTGLACDTTAGAFGPFAGQFFVGEFVLSGVNRVFLEKVGGEYQGAVFRFIEGLQCGPLGLAFLPSGSLVVGESNRGWNSRGSRSFGLERVDWSGLVPFEMKSMHAEPDGFTVVFTQPLDPTSAASLESYRMTSYTYLYHKAYGSPEVDSLPVEIVGATVSPDRRSVRLRCEGLREGYVHELQVLGVRSDAGEPVVHPEAYYTLNRRPAAAK